MPLYFASATQQNTNGSANTDGFLMNIHTIAGLSAWIQKLAAGSYATPADNAIRLRLERSTTLMTAGGAFTPEPVGGIDATASAVVTTAPTAGAFTGTRTPVQLAFNQRGTGLWAAFTADEAIGIRGATAPLGELVLVSQSTGTTVPVNFDLKHQE